MRNKALVITLYVVIFIFDLNYDAGCTVPHLHAVMYIKDLKEDFSLCGNASGVHVKEPRTDTGSEIALASSG